MERGAGISGGFQQRVKSVSGVLSTEPTFPRFWRRCHMLLIDPHRTHDHHGDHDDHGGLHRDLAETNAAMDRRGMLRLAARFGVALGAIQLIGCGADASALTGGRQHVDGRWDDDDLERMPDEGSRGDGRPVSRRQLQWPERAESDRRGAQRHPLELRRVERHSRPACRSTIR